MATPEPRHGARRAISIVDDVNLLSPQARTNLPLPLGPLTASFVSGLEGEVESSCSHPREAMNLFLERRISRRNRTASLVQRAVSKHDVSPGRSPWYSCPVRNGVRFPLSVPRVNGRRTGCFMHHAEGRVANPGGCPENPLRERLEQVGRHPRRTCRLALRTKDPGGPGSNWAPLLGTAGCAHDPAGGREAVGCSIHVDWGPGHPPQGDMCHSVADAEGF